MEEAGNVQMFKTDLTKGFFSFLFSLPTIDRDSVHLPTKNPHYYYLVGERQRATYYMGAGDTWR
jgi:hypothetical protein